MIPTPINHSQYLQYKQLILERDDMKARGLPFDINWYNDMVEVVRWFEDTYPKKDEYVVTVKILIILAITCVVIAFICHFLA